MNHRSVYGASRVSNLYSLSLPFHFPVSIYCFCFSKPTKIAPDNLADGLLFVRVDAPLFRHARS